jgi:hypothetical protein
MVWLVRSVPRIAVRWWIACWVVAIASSDWDARAEEASDREHVFVLEIGPAAEWPLKGEPGSYGGSIAVEKEVVENWLELELGVAALGSHGRGELSLDLLFKKPFHVSPEFELMVGAGPSFSRPLHGGGSISKSAELALDFMFWPSRNIGWFVEPTWTVNPATGRHSFAATGGLLIGF